MRCVKNAVKKRRRLAALSRLALSTARLTSYKIPAANTRPRASSPKLWEMSDMVSVLETWEEAAV